MNQAMKEIRKSCQDNVNQLGQTYRAMYDEIEKKLRRDVHAGEAQESALLDFSSMLLEAEGAGLTKDEIFPDGLDCFYEELTEALPVVTKEDRKRKNKRRGLLVIVAGLAVAAFIIGSKWAKMHSNTYVEGQDHPYMYQSLIGGMNVSYAKGEKDYYFQRGKYLYRFDPDTKKVSPLCTREDCLHSRQTDGMRYDVCNANMVGDDFDNVNIAYYDGNVYYITKHDNGYYTLNRVKEDGSEAETVKKWTLCNMDRWRWIIHRGYLYFFRSERIVDEQGYTNEEIYLKRMSLKAPEKEEILYRVEDEYGPTVFTLQAMTAYGNQIYFLFQEEAGDGSSFKMHLYRYDLLDNEMDEISVPEEQEIYQIFQITFLQNQMIMMSIVDKQQYNDACYFVSDLDGSNMRVLPDFAFGYIHSDDKYWYRLDTQNAGENGQGTATLYVYDLQGNEVDHLTVEMSYIVGGDIRDFYNISLGDDSGMFWIISSDEQKMWNIYWIDKNQVGSWNGTNLEVEPVDQIRYSAAYMQH